jgi:multidrug efflux pump
MKFTDFFIKRPVFSASISLFILFLGLWGVTQIPVRLFPKIDTSLIQISLSYPGASDETMESSVTKPVQAALSGIPDLDSLSAATSQSVATLWLHFQTGEQATQALPLIVERLTSIQNQLPTGLEKPVIEKQEGESNPLLLYTFTSTTQKIPEIYDVLTRVVKPQLEALPGVALARVLGQQYSLHLILNPQALASVQMSVHDVVQSLKEQNVQSQVREINGHTQQNIKLTSEFSSPADFQQLVIKKSEDKIIRLGDVGEVTFDSESDKISAYDNEQPTVMIQILPTSKANPLEVIALVKKTMPQLLGEIPSSISSHLVVDASIHMKASIKEVLVAMMESLVVVGIVMTFFFGNLRATLIPFVTIPLSLLGVCFFLFLFGFSLNLLTLLAMVIAIGLVVDDAIVVQENITRYREMGMGQLDAVLTGTREIAFSIVAMTLTLAAIFAPVCFLKGLSGQFISEFSLCLAGSALLSGIIALTLTPVMTTLNFFQGDPSKKTENRQHALKRCYLVFLEKCFHHKSKIILFWIFSVLGSFLLFVTLPREMAPKEDLSYLQVLGQAPNSTNNAYLADKTKILPSLYRSLPETKQSISLNGIPDEHSVLSFVNLVPWEQRERSSFQIQRDLQAKLNRVPALNLVAISPSSLPGTQGFPVEFVLRSPLNYENLYALSQKLVQKSWESGLFDFVTTDLHFNKPELTMALDRTALEASGLSVADVSNTLGTLLNQQNIQYVNFKGQNYKVIVEMPKDKSLNSNQLLDVYVKNQEGKMLPLSAFVSLSTRAQPEVRYQFQKLPSVTIQALPKVGVSLSKASQFLERAAKQVVTPDVQVDFSGGLRQYKQEEQKIFFLFLASFVFIYLLLAMQFESFVDPCLILLGSLPMAFFVALIPLYFGFATLNLYTEIAFLSLIGLVSKHGILLTKFAHGAQSQGMGKKEAILTAASVRFRPILMTTLAVLFGVLPLLFASGAGKNARFEMGLVLFTGMGLGTLCTLFVFPILYDLFSFSQKMK